MNFLSGKKTYIVGVGMILYGVGGWVAGIHDYNTAIKMVLEALAIMGLRAGVSKVTTESTDGGAGK